MDAAPNPGRVIHLSTDTSSPHPESVPNEGSVFHSWNPPCKTASPLRSFLRRRPCRGIPPGPGFPDPGVNRWKKYPVKHVIWEKSQFNVKKTCEFSGPVRVGKNRPGCSLSAGDIGCPEAAMSPIRSGSRPGRSGGIFSTGKPGDLRVECYGEAKKGIMTKRVSFFRGSFIGVTEPPHPNIQKKC